VAEESNDDPIRFCHLSNILLFYGLTSHKPALSPPPREKASIILFTPVKAVDDIQLN
jgi:hypothetical protein